MLYLNVQELIENCFKTMYALLSTRKVILWLQYTSKISNATDFSSFVYFLSENFALPQNASRVLIILLVCFLLSQLSGGH